MVSNSDAILESDVSTAVRLGSTCYAMPEMWACLQTRFNQVKPLTVALQSRNIPAFFPQYKSVQRDCNNAVKKYIKPLFPTYLFAPAWYRDEIAFLQTLPTTLRYHEIGLLESDVISAIREREDESGFVVMAGCEQPKLDKSYAKGDAIRLQHRAADIDAIFDSYLGDTGRVVVLAKLFNSYCRTVTTIEHIVSVW